MLTLAALIHAEYLCSKMQNTNKESEKKISVWLPSDHSISAASYAMLMTERQRGG